MTHNSVDRYDLNHISQYLLHAVEPYRKIFQDFWNQRLPPGKTIFLPEIQKFQRLNHSQPHKFLQNHPHLTFMAIKSKQDIVWSCRLFLRIDMILNMSANTSNIPWKLTKKIFKTFEVKDSLLRRPFSYLNSSKFDFRIALNHKNQQKITNSSRLWQ